VSTISLIFKVGLRLRPGAISPRLIPGRWRCRTYYRRRPAAQNDLLGSAEASYPLLQLPFVALAEG